MTSERQSLANRKNAQLATAPMATQSRIIPQGE
jgi:hypothetical protein